MCFHEVNNVCVVSVKHLNISSASVSSSVSLNYFLSLCLPPINSIKCISTNLQHLRTTYINHLKIHTIEVRFQRIQVLQKAFCRLCYLYYIESNKIQ